MLEPVESMSLTIAKAQLERGEVVTPNISTVLIWALIRITDDDTNPNQQGETE